MTLIPRQGRDYASRSEVLAAFTDEESFTNEDDHSVVDRVALERAGVREVAVRYHGSSRIATLEQASDGNWRAQ